MNPVLKDPFRRASQLAPRLLIPVDLVAVVVADSASPISQKSFCFSRSRSNNCTAIISPAYANRATRPSDRLPQRPCGSSSRIARVNGNPMPGLRPTDAPFAFPRCLLGLQVQNNASKNAICMPHGAVNRVIGVQRSPTLILSTR
jgi:hypothetical protein